MKRIFAKLTAALCAAAVLAVPISADNEEYVLPSGMTVAQFGAQMDSTAGSGLGKERSFASAAVGLFGDGEILYTGYFGDINIERKIPADENCVYEWGSISKTFVWVSAMQLREQGLLDLDADIRGYLPEGFFHNLSYDDPITMLNLMNHTAGWQETVRPVETTDESAVPSLKEALQACEPAQIHRPGEVTSYSNYGAALAGYVIECVSGTDYCEYVHKNILDPLGMAHTSVNPTHSDNAWVCEQRKKNRSYMFQMGNTVDMGSELSYIMPYPAGAVTGTLGDLMIYGQALISDDAPLFKSRETQQLLFTATSYYGSSDIPNCCHGFWAGEYGVRAYGHSGATAAGQADLMFDPISKVGLAVMINEPMGNMFLSAVPSLVFGTKEYKLGKSGLVPLKGNYLISRSAHRGLFRFLPYLTAISLDEQVYDIGNGVYLLGDENGAALFADKTYPDGTKGLEYGSMELIRDDAYIAELILLTLYVVFAAAALYFIRIRRKLKKAGRLEAHSGSAVMTAGNIALCVSLVTWLASYIVYSLGNGGISFGAGAVIGVIQMLCAAVCAVSAIVSLISLAAGKKKAPAHRYVLNCVLCVIAVCTVTYFEMYMFWGI